MKKIVLIITMIIFNMNLFSFSLNTLEFNEILKEEEIKEKEYTLSNNTNNIKRYSLSTNSKNITIEPKTFVLSPQKDQKFRIKVLGKGINGMNEFDLTVVEKNLIKDSTKKNLLYLNKVVQIKQKYFLKKSN